MDEYAPTCPACKQMYAKRNPPDDPPCETCREILLEENEEIARIYMEVRGQVITAGMGDIIDINILAIIKLMELYGIKDQIEVLKKVRNLFHYFLEKNKGKE